MEHLKVYPYEFIKPLLLSLDIMSRLNVHFFNKSDLLAKETNWRFYSAIPCVIIFYVIIILYSVRIFSEETTALDLAFSVSVFFIIIQAFFKAAIVIPKKKKIGDLIINLGQNWRTDGLNTVQIKKKDSDLNRLQICLRVFYYGSMAASWQVMLAPGFRTLRKLFIDKDLQFLLPFGCVLPFDPLKTWFRYIAVYCFEVYSMLHVIYMYIGSEILMTTLCALLSSEFAILREEFCHVKPVIGQYLDSNGGYTIDELIRKHQTLLLLAKELDDIFNRMLFVDLLFVTIIMCFFGFGITVAHTALDLVNNVISVCALLLPTLIFCYYGEQLKQESAGIADAAYNNRWYDGKPSYHKIIHFVIKRAQRPSCLTSLRHTPVTLNTFSKVVSTTWSYFSLITSIYGKD